MLLDDLAVREWDSVARKLLPFDNGVLDLETMKFEEHCPGYRLTWSLPCGVTPTHTPAAAEDVYLGTTLPVNLDADPYLNLCYDINRELARLGWGYEKESALLLERYGSRERACVSDEDLSDFVKYLQKQPDVKQKPKKSPKYSTSINFGSKERSKKWENWFQNICEWKWLDDSSFHCERSWESLKITTKSTSTVQVVGEIRKLLPESREMGQTTYRSTPPSARERAWDFWKEVLTNAGLALPPSEERRQKADQLSLLGKDRENEDEPR